jgi:hypothetical protein
MPPGETRIGIASRVCPGPRSRELTSNQPQPSPRARAIRCWRDTSRPALPVPLSDVWCCGWHSRREGFPQGTSGMMATGMFRSGKVYVSSGSFWCSASWLRRGSSSVADTPSSGRPGSRPWPFGRTIFWEWLRQFLSTSNDITAMHPGFQVQNSAPSLLSCRSRTIALVPLMP